MMNLETRQLLTVALASSLATAAGITVYNTWSKQRKRQLLNEDIRRSLLSSIEQTPGPVPEPRPRQIHGQPRQSSRSTEYDETLIREQLARNYAFFGEEAMSKVRSASVVVVGCGGVGASRFTIIYSITDCMPRKLGCCDARSLVCPTALSTVSIAEHGAAGCRKSDSLTLTKLLYLLSTVMQQLD
jgi:hypothetical protein